MSRRARYIEPGLLHHVTQRGNNREEVFRTDEDRFDYLRLLCLMSRPARVEIFGYCLMPNHVHLIVRPRAEDSLAVFMRQSQCEFSKLTNLRYGRCGHLWQSRYYCCALEGRHGLNALRYVDRNPVTARLVDHPRDWRWSSARAHCLNQPDEFGLLSMEWRTWWDWPERWEEYIAEPDVEGEEELRKHTRLGRRLGQARTQKVSVTS